MTLAMFISERDACVLSASANCHEQRATHRIELFRSFGGRIIVVKAVVVVEIRRRVCWLQPQIHCVHVPGHCIFMSTPTVVTPGRLQATVRSTALTFEWISLCAVGNWALRLGAAADPRAICSPCRWRRWHRSSCSDGQARYADVRAWMLPGRLAADGDAEFSERLRCRCSPAELSHRSSAEPSHHAVQGSAVADVPMVQRLRTNA